MTVKNPYVPPAYGVTHAAVERTAAGLPPASETEPVSDEAMIGKEPAKPASKAAPKPGNKAAK